MSALKAVARAIGRELGVDYDKAFESKSEWVRAGGMRDGKPVDVNEPRRGELDDIARAALIALRDCGVTEGMLDAWHEIERSGVNAHICALEFRAMLDAALDEG